jgi:hypothetical protein
MTVAQPADDGRLRVLRNVELLREPGVERRAHEFEVWADAHIVGDHHAPPYHLGIWEFSPRVGGGEPQRFYLRIESAAFPKSIGIGDVTMDSNPAGAIAEEFAMLAALFLRRRLRLGAQVREGDRPMWLDYSAFRGAMDPALLEEGANLDVLADGFRLVSGLNPEVQPRFILAARMYHQALPNIETAPDLAYLHLVSSIESLSRHHEIAPVPLEELDEHLSQLVSRVGDEGLRAELEAVVRKRERFIKRRFVDFVIAHTEEEFWAESTAPDYGRVKPPDLAGHLKGIYDQRSLTLHTGAPFPGYLLNAPIRTEAKLGPCEILFTSAVYIDGKSWTKDQFIPFVHFFERLVNHVLKVFIKRNQVVAA